jgi:excisionase family DNA binding protein
MSIADLLVRMDCFDKKLDRLLQLLSPVAVAKSHYTVEEAARLLDKSDYTVREYCRLGDILAVKTNLGCGQHRQWRIAAAELHRFMQEGKRRV